MTPSSQAGPLPSASALAPVPAPGKPDRAARPGRPARKRAAASHRARRPLSRAALTTPAAFLFLAVNLLAAACGAAPARPSVLHPQSVQSVPPGSSSPSAPVAATRPTAPVAVPANWKLAFSTDFPGTALDTATWDQCYPWTPSPPGCTNFGNADEREWYLPSQVHVGSGQLALVAQRTPTEGADVNGNPKSYTCRSGMVTTYHSVHFQYGVVQVTARLPFGQGLWPAIWLIPADGSWPPEIDLVEHWDTRATASATLHYGKQNRQTRGTVTFPQADQGWHTYTLYWTKTSITVYYDDTLALTTTKNIPQQPMYLLLDLANENNSPGSCDGTMYVKSVNIWEKP